MHNKKITQTVKMNVYCTNRNSVQPWILKAKLPVPIESGVPVKITATEMSLPNHWNNMGSDCYFVVYLLED